MAANPLASYLPTKSLRANISKAQNHQPNFYS